MEEWKGVKASYVNAIEHAVLSVCFGDTACRSIEDTAVVGAATDRPVSANIRLIEVVKGAGPTLWHVAWNHWLHDSQTILRSSHATVLSHVPHGVREESLLLECRLGVVTDAGADCVICVVQDAVRRLSSRSNVRADQVSIVREVMGFVFLSFRSRLHAEK